MYVYVHVSIIVCVADMLTGGSLPPSRGGSAGHTHSRTEKRPGRTAVLRATLCKGIYDGRRELTTTIITTTTTKTTITITITITIIAIIIIVIII